MSRSRVESLLCKILANEKPPKVDRLTVMIFVGLGEYLPENNYEQHQLAWYVWNPNLPRVRGRLVLMKDPDGNPLDQWQSREFNHPKACSSM